MPASRKYRIKDIRTGQYLPGVYSSKEVKSICDLKYSVSNYADNGNVWGARWKIEYADESEAFTEHEALGWQSEWSAEWEKARKKLLKAGGLL